MQQLLGCVGLVLVCLGSVAGAPGAERVTAVAERAPPVDEALQVLITTSELVVGQNRFAFGLLKEHTLLEQAQAAVRVYALQGQQGHLQTEVPAPYAPLEIVEQGKQVHVHPDGTRHVHNEQTDVRGIYVAQVAFERPGTWGLEVRAKQGDGPLEVSRFTVKVLKAPHTPALGTPAPRSHNLIASDVTDLRHIDTSEPPDWRLHQVRIADAIAQGTPQVIVFATPQFCTSRVCGPVVDVVRLLLPTYGDRVVFTHQEMWHDFTTQRLAPTVEEWHLHTEPWIFVVDGQGIIRAKFEGLTTMHEIATALQQILEPRQVSTPGGAVTSRE
jgi:hypothetical protein